MSDGSVLIEVEGVDAELLAGACDVEERINAAWVARVTCLAREGADAAPAEGLDLIGRRATVTLRGLEAERTWVGAVEEVESAAGHSVLRVSAEVGALAETRDYRVFVGKSATEIAREVLSEHGLSVDLRARREAPARAQCVQVWESDLDFCARVLAEEGMCWFPQPDDPAVVRVADQPDTFVDLGVTLDYREEGGLELGRAVHGARLRRRVTTDRLALRDYDFTHPQLELAGEAGEGALERYEYPGGFADPQAGREIAEIRLGERKAEELVLEAEATAPELEAGGVIEIRGAPEAAMNGRWLVIAAAHEVRTRAEAGEMSYRARLRAVPADRGYRAARPAARPAGGAGTAIVTGASGEEISLDDHGRTRLLLRWDRRSAADEKSSTFARVVQPQLSGSIFNPRVGWEQVVGAADRGGETPVLLGRLYNGAQPPPASLPGGKVETHFGTMTTPKGSSGNFIKINDTAGNEGLAIQASGDLNEQTENDKVAQVGVDKNRTIGAARKLIVKERLVTSVSGAHNLTVGALRKVTTDSNYSISAPSETIVVGGLRAFRVGGDYLTKTPTLVRIVGGSKGEAAVEHQSVFTKGVSTLAIGGSVGTRAVINEAIGVGGAALVKVSGAQVVSCNNYGLNVKGVYAESFSSRTADASGSVGESFRALTYEMKGGGKITGSEVAVQATAKLTIKAGGATIEMTPGSITINGNFEGWVASAEEGNHQYG